MGLKGVILAGGSGTRLHPMTKVFNKSLLPVYDKPMIMYPLESLKQLGCEEIMIVSGREHSGQIMSMLGSGISHDVALTYRVQEEPGGIAQALGICRRFAGNTEMTTAQYVRPESTPRVGTPRPLASTSRRDSVGVPGDAASHRVASPGPGGG